jgi:hypothetical protein
LHREGGPITSEYLEALSATMSIFTYSWRSRRVWKVVIGTISILGFEALVLFDWGATNSFVSIMFIILSKLVVRTLETNLIVATLVGKNVVCKRATCGCLVSICGRVLPANIVVLLMNSYEIIIKMD